MDTIYVTCKLYVISKLACLVCNLLSDMTFHRINMETQMLFTLLTLERALAVVQPPTHCYPFTLVHTLYPHGLRPKTWNMLDLTNFGDPVDGFQKRVASSMCLWVLGVFVGVCCISVRRFTLSPAQLPWIGNLTFS